MRINHPINPHNWRNLLYRADCKYALQHLISNQVTVDLIYLDPPFNSNRVYNMLYSQNKNNHGASQKAFHDMWTITSQTREVCLAFQDRMKSEQEISPIVKSLLETWTNSLINGGKK